MHESQRGEALLDRTTYAAIPNFEPLLNLLTPFVHSKGLLYINSYVIKSVTKLQ